MTKAERKQARQRAGDARRAAIANGDRCYISEIPCVKGHVGERYKNGGCVACAKTASTSEARLAYYRERYASKREEISVQSAISYQLNRERKLEYARNWARNNPEKRRDISTQYKHRRRATERDGVDTAIFRNWLRSQPRVCFYCGTTDSKFHVDHFMPLAKGGAHVLSNLRMACAPCNQAKSDKLPDVWIEQISPNEIVTHAYASRGIAALGMLGVANG